MKDEARPQKHVHFVAISGVGMASLAGLLHAQGYRVTGSDQNIYPPMSTFLSGLGIEVFSGYRPENIPASADLVVIGNAISRDNPEARAVFERGLPYLSLPQALNRFLIGSKKSIVVAGTHGKTTTASLLAWALKEAKWEPSFFIGGIPLNFQTGFALGSGEWVVMEGDEYDTAFFDKGPKFLHYKPETVVLTSIEFDHADIYRNLEHLKEAFRGLVALVPRGGLIVASSEYASVREVCQGAQARVVFYGGRQADWEARNVEFRGERTLFDAFYRGAPDASLETTLLGRHNVANALAAYALGRELGIERAVLARALATFSGVRRRQEVKGTISGVTLIDDFAHHPTAVSETIAAVRAAYPGRRLWAVFEPRSQTSRRKIFVAEFAQALAAADRVIVAGLYQPEKIPQSERLSPVEVVSRIGQLSQNGCAALHLPTAHEIAAYIGENAAPGDVILVMSNGGFDGVQEKIIERLSARLS
ncbi:MAG TPA: UDP-N-acetylmuramate:L-alanyl-gamma-D-glutamyl-meso-diaminopimelate ligase [Candidatus Acidoferrales bacterium]|nr:UDP-N-acetylmuramate:L-alanyl-gamma-D-glutamyl-meso-diaminopimelate ligase [Candidatus Acidoferrales bacterium]